MSVCPFDGSACCDDVCYGAGCLRMGGYPMLEVCDACGGMQDSAIPECSTCSCDSEDDYE